MRSSPIRAISKAINSTTISDSLVKQDSTF